MKIADIDYYSIYGESFLHKIKTPYKSICMILVISFSLITTNILYLSILTLVLYAFLFSLKFPKIQLLLITLSPLLFLIFYFLSFNNLTLSSAATTLLKALSCSTCSILLALTTPYVELIKSANKILPSFLINFIFLTYRSFFILWSLLEELNVTIHIRGELNILRPIYSLKIISNLIGFLIVKAIDKSEIMYDCMKVRGFSDSFIYLQD